MLLRANAHDRRVINVSLPSVEAAAALAPALGRLRAALPHHSLAFYAPAPPEGLPSIPGPVREHYTTVTWAHMQPSLVAEVAASDAARDFSRVGTEALRVIEASAMRTGFQQQLGLTPGQRLGLEPVPFRDAAAAANAAQAAAVARHLNVLEGGYSNKRVKLTDFSRGAGISCPAYTAGVADFGPHTIA